MTAISKCHVNYVHYVMLIMYMIPSASGDDLRAVTPYVTVHSVLRGDRST
jgi:hypothetical protein